MIINWKTDKETARKHGIDYRVATPMFGHAYDTRTGRKIEPQLKNIVFKSDDDIVEDYVFLNFPELSFTNLILRNCTFENCNNISVEEGKVVACTFKNTTGICFTETDVKKSAFCDVSFDDMQLIEITDANITQCTFANIEVEDEDAIICDAIGDVEVDHCHFENITADKDIPDLFMYIGVEGVFKRRVEYSVLDEDSCTGID